jgi:riboflavin kinase/FMN adenylyltransferase
MRELDRIEDYYSDKKTSITLGKFDGFHKGHQLLINKIREYSSSEVESLVIAFDVGGKTLLTKSEERQLMDGMVDVFIPCPLTSKMKSICPVEFIKEILVNKLNVKYIVVGSDFRFGYERRGDISLLDECSKKYGYQLEVIPKASVDGQVISSTIIKEALETGQIKKANELLGYEYELSNLVESGQKLGRTIGYPTLNIVPDKDKVIPRYGVYGCKVEVESSDGSMIEHKGICNIGIKPTATKENKLVVEVHVFDYDENAYGKRAKVKLLEFLRPEKKFDSIDELKEQIKKDVLYLKHTDKCSKGKE